MEQYAKVTTTSLRTACLHFNDFRLLVIINAQFNRRHVLNKNTKHALFDLNAIIM